jgi:hypothetical protein
MIVRACKKLLLGTAVPFLVAFSFLSCGSDSSDTSDDPAPSESSDPADGTETVDTSVHFSTSLQPLFEEALTDGVQTNNVSCIYCHSPSVPITGSTTSDVACNDSGSTDCHGRGDSALFVTALSAVGAGTPLTSYNGVLFSAPTSKFPKGGSGSTARVSFANAFVNTISGYTFDCSKVKALLEVDTSRVALTSPIDPTLSMLYNKLSAATPVTGGQMPKNDVTKGAQDAVRNPVVFTADQLALLVQWYNEGGDCMK